MHNILYGAYPAGYAPYIIVSNHYEKLCNLITNDLVADWMLEN